MVLVTDFLNEFYTLVNNTKLEKPKEESTYKTLNGILSRVLLSYTGNNWVVQIIDLDTGVTHSISFNAYDEAKAFYDGLVAI